jgi:ubiquinone/menaquinone biosynthesis C-methylase UbiE
MAAVETPNPLRVFDALNSFQRTFALKAAIELDLFRHIAAGATRVPELSARLQASQKGVRVLCDYLTISGFLQKQGDVYALAADTALFLDSKSPAYVGSGVFFLAHPRNVGLFADLTEAVRRGGTPQGRGNLDIEAPIWVDFARWMAPLSAMAAGALAEAVNRPGQAMKVLDIAAGHGAYGLAIARLNPRAEIYAQDWKNVLALARERAEQAGAGERYHLIPGDAFEVEFGSGYDVALLPNFLHHFDHAANVGLLRRVRAALVPGGRAAVVEFVPDDDRVTPAPAAAFSLTMLATTENGDAYTFRELDAMLREAGFTSTSARTVGPQTLLVAET